MEIAALLDLAKAKQSLDSDNRLALALVVSRGMVSAWRKGERAPDAQNAMKLADMAELDRLEVLAICELHRETDPKRRAYWAMFRPGLRRVASMVAAVIGASLFVPQDVRARSLEVSGQAPWNINSRTICLAIWHKLISAIATPGRCFLTTV